MSRNQWENDPTAERASGGEETQGGGVAFEKSGGGGGGNKSQGVSDQVDEVEFQHGTHGKRTALPRSRSRRNGSWLKAVECERHDQRQVYL